MFNSRNKLPKKPITAVRTLSLLMLGLSLTALLVTFIAQVLVYGLPSQQEIVIAKQELIAEQAGQVVDNFIQAKFSEMEAAVKVSAIISASPDEQKNILENVLSLDRAIRQVSLFDENAQELVTVSRLSQAASRKMVASLGGNLFTQIRQTDRFTSPVYVDINTSEPLVIMAVPIKDVFGDYQGTLLSEVNLKFMWELVSDLKVGETGYAYVVDRQGNLLALRDTSRVLLHENLNQVAIVHAFMEDQNATKAVTVMKPGINNTQVIGTYLPLAEKDWAVVTELPIKEAIQSSLQIMFFTLAVIIIMVGLVSWIAARLARRLSNPIIELTKTAERIAQGELNIQATMDGPLEIAALAQSFNAMTTQLRQSLEGLTRRTRALETSQQVSRRLAEIFDERQLVAAVVNEVQSAFNYYHAHIYLFDEARQNLVMVGGTGEAGRVMLAQGHKIPKGRGLVGRAADNGQVVLISDVSQAPEWLPNPLLPDTRAEIAVPIHLGNTIYGVLDVQQNVVNGLSQEDAQLLEGIANQIAIALQNARSYVQARQEAEQEALINSISQKIQQASNIDTVLQIASRELAIGLGAKKSVVQIKNPHKMTEITSA